MNKLELPGTKIKREQLLTEAGLKVEGDPFFKKANPGIVAALNKCLLSQSESKEKTDKVQS